MSFQAPDLFTAIDRVNYENEINSNFSSIDSALKSIQSELAVAQPNPGGAQKLDLLEWIANPNGVVGTDSFQLSFATDDESLSIAHSPNRNKSSAIINSRFFESNANFSIDLRTLVPSDGTFRIAVGLKDNGSPSTLITVVQSDGSTGDDDADIDLLLWDFDYTKSGAIYTIENLRRRATVLISRESFEEAHQAEMPLSITIPSLPSAVGLVEQGILIPWDCEIQRAYLRLGTAPTDAAVTDPTVEIELITPPADTDSEVVLGTANWSDLDVGEVRELVGFPDPKQLSAGQFVQPNIIQADGDGTAGDLSITLVAKRIYHPIF